MLVAAIAVAGRALVRFWSDRIASRTHRSRRHRQGTRSASPRRSSSVATTAGLFDLKGTDKPVFLEVFATWCPHCQRETAVIDRLYNHYQSRVDFVGVSGSDTAMDGTSAASQLDVLKWAQRFNVQYPVAYDPLLNVANLYLQGGFPTFAVIGNDKSVAYLNSGEISYQELSAAISKVLRAAPALPRPPGGKT